MAAYEIARKDHDVSKITKATPDLAKKIFSLTRKVNDLDGDGLAEIPVASPWGIGILKLSGNTLKASMIASNGTRFGGWLLNTVDNNFCSLADFDGDFKTEILVTSPWGIGILKLSGNALEAPILASNGTRFGGWLLSTQDNRFGPVGDFDGDGKTEILIISAWGMGILKLSGSTLEAPIMIPNGTKLGNWILNTSENRFGPAGDFDGDGKTEFLVTGPTGIGILKLSGNTLTPVMLADNNTSFGGWLLNTADNVFVSAGDFDGDGKKEILVTSPWGIGILKLSGNALTAPFIASNGTRFGGWLLNTADNRFNVLADFDGDGKTEILVTSPWGTGILKLSGNTLSVPMMAPNGTRFGGWLLNTADNDLELGNWNAHAVIIYHNDWINAMQETQKVLQRRGYTVHTTDNGSTGLSLIKTLSLSLKTGDRLIVYLAGHGYDPRGSSGKYGDMDKAVCLDHFVQFNQEILYLKQLDPLFKTLGNMGIDLTVIDGSCNGGETVYNATGDKYCAVATTGVYTPGLTNFPNPSEAIQQEGRPGTFGLWWMKSHLIASRLNGAIITGVPTRFHQRLYRNDNTDFSPLSLFIRPAVDSLKMLDLGGWNLHYQYCYLYKYIYSEDYEALPDNEKTKFTNATQTYINFANNIINPQRPLIEKLHEYLNNEDLITKASVVYSDSVALAWQMLANDPGWNPIADPDKHLSQMYQLSPKSYKGTAGFKTMVTEVNSYVTLMEECYKKQEALLWQIDESVKNSGLKISLPKPQKQKFPVFIPDDPVYYKLYEKHERETSGKLKILLDNKKSERTRIFLNLSDMVSRDKKLEKIEAAKIIETNLNLFKDIFIDKNKNSLTLAELIAQFKAISVAHFDYLGKSSFLLSIIEDAICKVQSGEHFNPGDIDFC